MVSSRLVIYKRKFWVDSVFPDNNFFRSLTAGRLPSSDDFSSGWYYFPQTTLIIDDFLPQKIYFTFQVPWRLKLMMISFCSVFSSPSFRKYCCSSLGFRLLLRDDFSCMSCSTYTELLRDISKIQRCVHIMTSAQEAVPFSRRLQLMTTSFFRELLLPCRSHDDFNWWWPQYIH